LVSVSRSATGFRRTVIGASFALLIMSKAAVVYAQGAEPTPAELRAAAEAFDRGREAYKDEHFAEAAGQFERADASAPSATALGLAIKARDKAGDLDRAGTLAALGLERYPDDTEIQAIAPDVLTRARASLYEVTISCSEPCELADGTKIVHGAAAKQRIVFLTEGAHALRAGFADGRSESKSVEAAVGTTGALSFEGAPAESEAPPEAAPPPPPPPEPEKEPEPKKGGGLPPVVFWAGLGATAVAGGITIWSGIDTVNNPGEERVKAECAPHDEQCPTYLEGRSKQTRTNILIGVTAGLAVATGVLAIVGIDWGGGSDGGDETAHRAPRVEPWLSFGDGATVGARGTF